MTRARLQVACFTDDCFHHSDLCRYTHTHTPVYWPFVQDYPGKPVKPIWILLKQETVSGSGISWAICKSSPHSRQITMPAPHHSVFYRPDAIPAAQPTASKHRRQSRFQQNLPIIMFQVYRWQPDRISQWMYLLADEERVATQGLCLWWSSRMK